MDSMPGGSMAPQQSWWSRNWKWVLPVGCLGMLASCGCLGFAFLGWGLSTLGDNMGAYTEAVAIATGDDEVRAVLGPPVQGGLPSQTSMETRNGRKHARFAIPLDGTQADGVLHVDAEEDGGGWSYQKLEVELQDGRRIDLRDVAPGPMPGGQDEAGEPGPPSEEDGALPPPPPGPPPPPEGPPGSGQGGSDINL
jgi:hypothetical protein